MIEIIDKKDKQLDEEFIKDVVVIGKIAGYECKDQENGNEIWHDGKLVARVVNGVCCEVEVIYYRNNREMVRHSTWTTEELTASEWWSRQNKDDHKRYGDRILVNVRRNDTLVSRQHIDLGK